MLYPPPSCCTTPHHHFASLQPSTFVPSHSFISASIQTTPNHVMPYSYQPYPIQPKSSLLQPMPLHFKSVEVTSAQLESTRRSSSQVNSSHLKSTGVIASQLRSNILFILSFSNTPVGSILLLTLSKSSRRG
mmetsp:Transcript_43694/g.113894  ORF Transcript_43694/g.113894 Transcript_43694/m.113894 type:complete len:132 (-) Transcript_43694:677-1072(-)